MSKRWDSDVLNLKRAFKALWASSDSNAREAALRWLWAVHEEHVAHERKVRDATPRPRSS